MKKIKIALGQMTAIQADTPANMKKIEEMAERYICGKVRKRDLSRAGNSLFSKLNLEKQQF